MLEKFTMQTTACLKTYQFLQCGVTHRDLDKIHFCSHISDDSTRVKLCFFPGVDGSDYINASYIDVSHGLLILP